MAYAIPRSTISNETVNIIESMLCLYPNVVVNKYNSNNVRNPITFYDIDKDFIHVPYLFAASLLQILPNINISYPITNLQFTGKLRENQEIVESESWEQLEKYGTSTLGLYPGFGKTILGAKLASRTKLMTVVLVHRETLTKQWKKTFEEHTNGKVWIVGEKYPPQICDVIICMDTRWHLIPKTMRDAVGFLIIDEAHCFCTPTHVGCLLAFHPKYILAESASLLRDDDMHQMIYAICGEHGVFKESTKPFSVMKIITNTKPIRKHNRRGGVDWNALVQSTLFDERRNQIIFNLVTANLNHKIIILTSLVDHALLIHNGLKEKGISCDYMCGTKKNYDDATVLTGTISKIGTGFDQANFCPTYSGTPFNLLILVCSLKKYSMLVQNVGRCFRSDYPFVMHLVDNDDIFKGHWYKARKWYLKHCANITEYSIPNLEISQQQSQNINDFQKQWVQNKIKSLTLNCIK